jgi:hypothetical protein
MRAHHMIRAFILFVSCIIISSQNVSADTLYGATGSRGIAGHLYILDPNTGVVITDVGPLRDAQGNNYGLTGLAFEPATGKLFGSVANQTTTPSAKGHLVSIDPSTAQVTDIGSFGFETSTMSDITFDPLTGTLYGWRSGDDHGLYEINKTNGTATLVGGETDDFGGGGLAADLDGTFFSTYDGQTGIPSGHLFSLDKPNGASTIVDLLSGPFSIIIINAMDFNSGGALFGVQTARGNPALTNLVTIDPATAAMTNLGQSVNDLDAIAFLRSAPPDQVPEPASVVLFACGLAGAFFWVNRPELRRSLVRIIRKRNHR